MLYDQIFKPIAFSFDPETVHEATLAGLKTFGRMLSRDKANDHPSLSKTVAGIKFPNPVGLAAGMDKACVAPLAWQGIGFGFIEIGTVTNQAQEGNEKPRLFRLPQEESLLNRLGFNNPGASEVAKTLNSLRRKENFGIPLGVNIGKSRVVSTKDREAVIKDYLGALNKVQIYADYLTINVSSPNTPGLREWESPQQLMELLKPLKEASEKPIFLKISPDMELESLDGVLIVASELQIDGLIATNTTVSRDNSPQWTQLERGGISGKLLKEKSLAFAKEILKRKSKELAFISVGGISSADDVKERLDLGADLVQIYTGLVFQGPQLITQINKALLS